MYGEGWREQRAMSTLFITPGPNPRVSRGSAPLTGLITSWDAYGLVGPQFECSTRDAGKVLAKLWCKFISSCYVRQEQVGERKLGEEAQYSAAVGFEPLCVVLPVS